MSNQTNTKDTHSKEPKRAVCYLRVASAHDKDQTTAIDAQRQACERKARELGVDLVEVYIDQGANGNTKSRPALQRMLARIESNPPVSCVITYDHARLARNIEVYRKIVETLKAAGVELAIAKEPGPHFHAFMQTLTIAMAELDARNRREIRRSRRAISR